MDLVFPSLAGRRVQKIVQDQGGAVFFHFDNAVLKVTASMSGDKWIPKLTLKTREKKPDPLVIPAP